MARDRARSSFTVEVRRGRGGEGGAKPSLWQGLNLAEAAPQEVAAPQRPVARPPVDPFAQRAAPSREAPRGRVLPSLLAAEPSLVEEPAPEPARPEPLPRVRRPRRIAAAPVADAAPAAPAPEIAPPATPLPHPQFRRRPPRGEQVLRAGERWKRRLPRSLW